MISLRKKKGVDALPATVDVLSAARRPFAACRRRVDGCSGLVAGSDGCCGTYRQQDVARQCAALDVFK